MTSCRLTRVPSLWLLLTFLLIGHLLTPEALRAELIEVELSPPPDSPLGAPEAAPIPVPILSDAELDALLERLRLREQETPEWYEAALPGLDSPRDDRGSLSPGKALTGVSDTTQYPYRALVKLTMNFGGGYVGVCSGSILAPGWVMTAGHCVYDNENRRQARSIEIVPAKAGNQAPYGKTSAERMFYFTQWSAGGEAAFEYDAALLKMSANLLESYLGWEYSSNLQDYRTTIYTAGYPAAEHSGEYMYENSCAVNTALHSMLLLNCDAEGGQSGSAAWWMRSGTQGSIGVLSFGTNDHQTGIIRLRPEILSAFHNEMGTCRNECTTIGESVCASTTDMKYCVWNDQTYCNIWNTRACADNTQCQGTKCVCIPDCTDKECGTNGCNGVCGSCSGDRPICNGQTFTCVECSTAQHCGAGKLCEDGVCVVNPQCLISCEKYECGLVQGCPCGECPDSRPLCNYNLCFEDPSNPVDPTDGDEPADGDEVPACVGACSSTDTPFCVDKGVFCACDGRQWISQNCGIYCRDLGGVSLGCDFDITRNPAGCECAGVPDGTADGDDDGAPSVPDVGGSGGCRQPPTSAATFLLLLLSGLLLMRRRVFAGRDIPPSS